RRSSDLRQGSASAWGEDVELVTLRVGQARPRHVALADVDAGGAESLQPGHLRRVIVTGVRPQVEMHADLGLVEGEVVLRVGDRLRGFDRLPAEVELTNPRHPLAGQRVPVVSAYRRGGGTWLVVVLPDGLPAGVPVDDTDLGRAPVAAGVTVLSVAGIRRLRELAAAMAAGGRAG